MPRQLSNSELGEYLDRLLATTIVKLAQNFGAASIALPKLDRVRLNIQSEIDTMAQQKIPDFIEGQKNYAKQVRVNLHNWSYDRLSDAIVNKAARSEIAIEYGNQPVRASPSDQAREIALSAYFQRTI